MALVLAAMAAPELAFAQTGMDMGQGMGVPTPSSPAQSPSKPSNQPQTHAASGAEDATQLPTQEPTLPSDPLEIPPEVKKQIGTTGRLAPEPVPGEAVDRRFYGLWYSEKSKDYQFRTTFPLPLWSERRAGNDRASLFGLVYFNRRSPKADADVLFPLFWRFREDTTYTTAVGPFVHQERKATATRPGGHSNWLPPLFFEGSWGKSGYLHIPPLLTFTQHSDHAGLNIVGPMFCRWKGGPACDTRTADNIDLGLAPLYFYGRDEAREYELIPPLLHYYQYNEVGESYVNVWGPYIRTHDKDYDNQHVLPFYYRTWGKNEDHLTVFPFFHYGYKGTASRLITPLFYWSRGENGERTFVTWGYAHHKGRTELQMITPLYWHYKDPDIGLDRHVLFPFLWKSDSPRGKELAVFPFYGRFQRYGLSDETWVTPFFRYRSDTTGWQANLFPIVHVGQSYNSHHLVIAPFLWDFASPTSRTTIVLPGFFRFADQHGVSQLALNTYYQERKVPGGISWEFHFFPFFSYGASPVGHWWNVFYGLAGYTHEGTRSQMRLVYIPITLSK